MTFVDWFAGIGGFRLGLERAGMRCVWSCEIADYPRKVYAQNFGHEPEGRDIHDVRPEEIPEADLWCGGFPCQPFSVAGKRHGEKDDRNFWPAWWRLIRLVRPRLLLMENVPGLLTSGYFGRILGDLASVRYGVEWDCIPAAAVGAPHRRDRLWIVADRPSDRSTSGISGSFSGDEGNARVPINGGQDVADAPINGRDAWRAGDTSEESGGRQPHRSRECPDVADPLSPRLEVGKGQEGLREFAAIVGSSVGDADQPPQDTLTEGRGSRPAISQSGWWDTEPDVGRVAHGVPSRVDRLKGLGNAVVPQVVEWIGRRLMEQRG